MATRRRARPILERLTLYDYNDRELLLIIMNAEDSDGFATTLAIATALSIEGDRRLQSVGSRCASLRRLGLLDKRMDLPIGAPSAWTVTALGRMIATGQLKVSTERMLDGLNDGEMLLVLRKAAQRAANGHMGVLSREWRSTTGRR